MKKNNAGFTLIELLVAIVIAGVLGAIASSNLALFSASSELVRSERAKEENLKAGAGLLEHARAENKGRLIAPYTGGGLTSAVTDPADTTLTPFLRDAGLNPNTFNFDGYAAQRVRVYQRITQTENIPFFNEGGETVTITFDVGVVYQTNCSASDSTCNPSPSGLPGQSALLTASNVNTWNTTGSDLNPYMFSTYQLQKQMVAQTAEKLLVIRDSLKSFFYHSMMTSPPGDTTNFYPSPTGAGAPNLAGATVATNEGCRDGWYSLNSSAVNVLSSLNLTPSSYYGLTSFGGAIEYCRDFDPSNTSADTPPHGVALRINRSISSGTSPATGGNFILSF